MQFLPLLSSSVTVDIPSWLLSANTFIGLVIGLIIGLFLGRSRR